ncbi:hypothetical protein HFO21_07980 [Rhizobium laguerreae]|uniref:nSTAND3 domain-containing NTPase n=1 Tax=Rhizobium laguerreae TaxID=1076926 RepID=UPI001C909773|nr:hypothetical protein [Rhizobium laguerreae]MBY3214311.1 hypothetical protein [Rhizobium laguerreae]
MTEPKDGSGNPSYVAYEYQIEVSAWIAVDLLLARRLCEEIAIEAKSKEDVEADIEHQFPTTGLTADKALLTIQIKTKSTGAWTSSSFAKVLRGDLTRGDDPAAPAKGPAPRIRPLEMLRQEKERIYLFITDAAVEPALFPFRVNSSGDPSEAKSLPYRSGETLQSENDAEQIAPRISIIQNLSRELVRLRLEKLLRSHANVPEQHIAKCISALIQEIRDRMLDRAEGKFSRVHLRQVISQHGGSVNASRNLDRYVEPQSLRRIERLLKTENAVIITGPSGTGKTMTADYIEERLLRERGYEVIDAEDGPEEVRHALRSPGVHLFHLKDPFGKTRYIQSRRPWASELLSLLREAGPDKRFLITTRSDVIHESNITLNSELDRRLLEHYSVPLEATDYNDAARARIYDNHVSELRGEQRSFAVASRKRALSQLLRPFEIDRFVLAIKVSDETRDLDKLIAQSQVEAIARVVCDQITQSSEKEKAIASAAIIWALISGCGAANREILRPVRRLLRRHDVRVDLEAFSELMLLGSNLRDARDQLTFPHPQVAKGFALAMQADEDATEDALTGLIETLISMDKNGGKSGDWGAETANRFRRQLIDDELKIEPAISAEIGKVLDLQLENALQIEDAGRFSNRIRDIAVMGSEDSIGARFARCLVHEKKTGGGRAKPYRHFGYFWTLSDEDAAMVADYAASDLCRFIARRFVADMLFETSIIYRGKLAGFLHEIDPSLARVAHNALRTRVSNALQSVNNLGAAVWLALSSETAPIDDLIAFFLEIRRQRAPELDNEQVRQAMQDVLDEGYSEFVLDRARDELHVPSEGLQSCIRWLRKHNPANLHAHPRQEELLEEWLRVCVGDAETVSAEEIDLLFDLLNEESGRSSVWEIVGKAGSNVHLDRLKAEIGLDWGAGPDLREARIVALSRLAKDEFAARLRESIPSGSEACLLTSLFDYARAHFAFDNNERGERELVLATLRDELPAELRALLDLLQVGDEAVRRGDDPPGGSAIDEEVTRTANRIVGDLSEDLQIAVIVANPYITQLAEIARRLIGSERPHIAAAAVRVLGKLPSWSALVVAQVWNAFKNDDYHIRAAALEVLVPRVGIADRAGIARRGSEDESASVRLCFAKSMHEQKWPESLGALCMLLGDDRDFDPFGSYGERQTSLNVARAAAEALGAFSPLPEAAIAEIILRASTESTDSKLGPALLNILQLNASTLVDNWLLEASAGNVPGFTAEVALWELVRRADEGTLPAGDHCHALLIDGLASPTDDRAIPALITIALQTDQSLVQRAWSSLDGPNLSKFKSLLIFAAIMHGKAEVKSWVVDQLNLVLPQDRIAHLLVRADGGEEGDFHLDEYAREWLHSLDPDNSLDHRLRLLLKGFYEPEAGEGINPDPE